MKKIAVKIGWELIIPINIILFYFLYGAVLENKNLAIIVNIATIIFVNVILFGIKYSFENEFLRIKSLFHNVKIDIKTITKIEKTSNLLSSPAPSLFGRVEIYYQNNSIVISPKNFEEFKHEMLAINPNIDFKN